jgi:arabinofuranosyltransferase
MEPASSIVVNENVRDRDRAFPDPRSALAIALVLVPVLIIVWMGWRHRWTSDDAFVNLRVVRQIREGHGPVFNIGDRVEASTSPLWVGVLALLDLVTPFRLEWIAVFAALGATAAGLAFAILGTRRAWLEVGASAGAFVPLGAVVYVVLPPAWDYATSGLENGLGLLWIGASWWLLTRRLAEGRSCDPSRPWWVAVVLGIGPLIRPDFLILSAFFVLALLLLSDRGWEMRLLAIGLGVALPVASELFRMGYYGNLVPNTALAKEASLSNWQQGWDYLLDFFGPYILLLPLLLLLGAFITPLLRAGSGAAARFRLISALTIAAGILHGLYIVRVGGDFMHARMLLPSLFVVLLPVSVVAVRGWAWVAATAVLVWTLVCAATLRPAYSGAPGAGQAATVLAAIDPVTKISDERLVHVRLSSQSHPVTIDDYERSALWAQGGLHTHELEQGGRRGLLLDPDSAGDRGTFVPLRKEVTAQIVAYVGALGMYSYAAGDDVYVIDRFGLANAISAHQKLVTRGRPGHEKDLQEAWVFAQFADPGAAVPALIPPADVTAARHALACGQIVELLEATQGTLDVFDNLRHSLSLWNFRFSPSPAAAERDLCGDSQ